MSYAITYTVKNEAHLLPHAIRYHKALGCRKFYVFWDGTTDDTPELIKGIDIVVARNSVRPEEVEGGHPWFQWIAENWEGWMDLRKMLNMHWAARQARQDGMDWLVAIDADELIIADKSNIFSPSSFDDMLRNVPDDVDQILMKNMDVVAEKISCANPFADYRYFFTRISESVEFIWRYSRAGLRKIFNKPEIVAWYDQLFFKIILRAGFPRVMRDPASGKEFPTGYYLSYFNYKSVIRTKRSDKFRPMIHKWANFKGSSVRPKSIVLGNVLHYDFIDCTHFMNKYRQRQPTTNLKAHYSRWMFSEIAHRSDDQVQKFFQESVLISDQNRLDELERAGVIVKILGPSDYFRSQAGAPALQNSGLLIL